MGWKFDSPFRHGGSSRFLTIAYLIVPENKYHLCNRFVKNVYREFKVKPKKELKATTLKIRQKVWIAEQGVDLLNLNPDFRIGAITVNKEKVFPHIRTDANKLYNYMMAISILDKVKTSPKVNLIRDERSVKVASGNSCIDYMQTKMWFDHSSPTMLIDSPTASHLNLNLIFIDWIANFVWSHYEDKNSEAFIKLSPKLSNQTLYF